MKECLVYVIPCYTFLIHERRMKINDIFLCKYKSFIYSKDARLQNINYISLECDIMIQIINQRRDKQLKVIAEIISFYSRDLRLTNKSIETNSFMSSRDCLFLFLQFLLCKWIPYPYIPWLNHIILIKYRN